MHNKITNTPILIINPSCSNVFDETIERIKDILTTTLEPSYVDTIIEKIQKNVYVDFAILDGKEMNKNDVINLQEKYLFSDFSGDGYKFYLIKNLDCANKYIQNSLLKFIEEPPKNTYGFFSAKSKNSILNTITSRCNIIYTKSNHNNIDKNSFEYKISNIYNSLFYLHDVKYFIDEFKKMNYQQIESFLEIIKQSNDLNFTKIILDLLKDIKLNLNKNLLVFKLLKLKGF